MPLTLQRFLGIITRCIFLKNIGIKRLSTERLHHTSKRRRYTLVLVPDEDALKGEKYELCCVAFYCPRLCFSSLHCRLLGRVVCLHSSGTIDSNDKFRVA